MPILTVIPFTSQDWERAEHLLDWIYQQRKQASLDHVLLVASEDTHPEMRLRVRISASLAFDNLLEFAAPKLNGPDARFHLFRQAAIHLGRSTRWPWLYMEPDCVPTNPQWMQRIEHAYEAQPCRYMGAHCKTADDAIVLGRCAVYPASAINDIDAKRDLVPLSSKCRLIQYGSFTDADALDKVRIDAVLFNSCPTDALISALRKQAEPSLKKA